MLNFTGKGEQISQASVLQFQQMDLLLQCLGRIKGRTVQDGLDLLQRKLQFPKQQNLLQAFQSGIVLQPIARGGFGCGL